MKEIKNIIRAYDEAQKQGHQTALATVVHLEGSSYRRPGARMLVTEEGQMTGAISGGCLEGDALRKALLVMNQRQSKLVTYDTSDEEDSTIGVQLGCAGIIQILIEPLNMVNPQNPISLLKRIGSKRQRAVLITLFQTADKKNAQIGTCMLLEEEGDVSGDLNNSIMKKTLQEDATAAMSKQQSLFKNYVTETGTISAFIEYIRPAVSLVIIGAGNDAIPLVEMADTLGWETRIADGRPSHATADRFTSACQVLVAKPEKVLEQIEIDEQTVFVLMTHNYNYDLAMLKALLQTNAIYIGVLGPRKKLDRMLDEITAEGMKMSEEQLKRVFGPVGLDIGAETAEEIALSIIAEIKGVLTGKPGNSLREKNEAIHSRDETIIEEKRLH